MGLIEIHGIVSIALAVLIWVIQWVHYPFFIFIDPQQATRAYRFHQYRISFLVIPLMVTELVTASWLMIVDGPNAWLLHTVTLASIAGIWVVTAGYMVPRHRALVQHHSVTVIDELVKYNWIRTFLWTGKAILWSIYMLTGV